eukprot:scpid28177/ scgid3069/ 
MSGAELVSATSSTSATSVSTLRQQLEHERRTRQHAETRCRELKLENERCTIRFHELQRNFEGIQTQLRQMIPKQKQVEQLRAENVALQSRLDDMTVATKANGGSAAAGQHDKRADQAEQERYSLQSEIAVEGTEKSRKSSSNSLDSCGSGTGLHTLQEENNVLREELSSRKEKYDKTLSEITGEIVSTLTKYQTACQEKRELQEKFDQQKQYNVSLERKNQTLVKLLCRIKSKQPTLPSVPGEDDSLVDEAELAAMQNGGGAATTAAGILGKGSSLSNLDMEPAAPRAVGHLPTRSASLRSSVHPLRRVGLRRSASGEVSHQEDNMAVRSASDLASSDYSISTNYNRSATGGGNGDSQLSTSNLVIGDVHRHRALHSAQSKTDVIREQSSSGESRPPSMQDLHSSSTSSTMVTVAAAGSYPSFSRVSRTPDALLLQQQHPPGMGSKAAALSATSLNKLEAQLSRCTNRSIDSATADQLRRMKRDGLLAAQIRNQANENHILPATPSPPSRGSLIESDSSDEEEDHINFVEMWKKRATAPDTARSRLGNKGRPLSHVEPSMAQKMAGNEKALDPKTSSLPRNVSLSTATINEENSNISSRVCSAGTVGSSNHDQPPRAKRSSVVSSGENVQSELEASARANLLDNLVTRRGTRTEISPPQSPGRVPSLAEAKDYLRCLRRRNVDNEKPLRGPMTIIKFHDMNFYNRFDTPEQTAIAGFDFLDTFSFIEPSEAEAPKAVAAAATVAAKPRAKSPVKKSTGKSTPETTTRTGTKPTGGKSPAERKPPTPTRLRSGTPTGGSSRTLPSAGAERKTPNLSTKRTSSGGSIGMATSSASSSRAPSPQVSDKRRTVASATSSSSTPATRTKSSAPSTSKTASPKVPASKTTSSPLRSSPASSTSTGATSSTTKSSSSGGRRLGALLGHHGSSSSKSSSATSSSSSSRLSAAVRQKK